MNLIRTLRGMFSRTPKLRNKPQGMAWIHGFNDGNGTEVINGRAVKTIRLNEYRNWVIDPPQLVKITVDTHYTVQGVHVRAGDVVSICAIADHCLEPWRDTGLTQDEVTALYSPERERERV